VPHGKVATAIEEKKANKYVMLGLAYWFSPASIETMEPLA